jgi:S1-C subfamily serine protease
MRRPAAIASVALVAALIGAAATLLVAKAAGWVDGESKTVVREIPAPVDGGVPASIPRRVRPLVSEGFDPAAIYASRAPGVVTIYAFFDDSAVQHAAQGSGFVVSRTGLILTNSHVITDAGGGEGDDVISARRVYVEFQDRDRVPAKIVGFDVFDDVGVLRVDPRVHALTVLPLGDSSTVRVGEPVAAIGSPFGNENSLAVGVVSATRSIASLTSRYNLPDAIQVDAPINHGNSGGPLFDARGRVIGINAQIRSDSGTAEGVGFAVPINAARRSMTQLVATGRVAYAYVGISTEDLTPSLARRFGYPVRYGAVITSVRPGAPGAKAGLRGGREEREFAGTVFTVGGDVVLAVDGEPIRSAEDVVRAVVARRPGQTAVFTILRGDERRRVPLVLAERPKNPDSGR